ncbi:MAG: tRNA cyclic N6-threonylcarbamoyladenosine(37) synthase TcdA [Oleiphilaceae bacterium]|nr:tRNA cyclic N6-threonylcarbamoyladenosine(37) synthase TcdA [Oleiphilaceae bacterium]
MVSDAFADRFGGIERLYGRTAAHNFSRSHVAVVGIGGVGTWAAEALARSGVGALTLIDLDEVCISNSNRQVHALAGQYGRPKVEVMAERIQAINPHCRVTPVMQFTTAANVATLIHDKLDAVVDAIDSVKHKAALLAHCQRRKLWVICAGGAGGQTDPTQIRVADLARTTQDPLLAKVRNLLRREYGFSRNPKRRFSIPAVYSTEQLRYPVADGGISHSKPGEGPTRLDCATGFGAASFVTGTFGFVAAGRVLERLSRP